MSTSKHNYEDIKNKEKSKNINKNKTNRKNINHKILNSNNKNVPKTTYQDF